MNSGQGATDQQIQACFKSDQYRLLEKIGAGGFGQVYKAEDLKSHRLVAIKFLVLGEDFDSDKRARYLERFERESQLCARLDHPNIVKLLDKGFSNDNLIYAVYEFIDGESLKDIIRQERLDAVAATAIMAQVLDAITHAHDQGVIHRDLKPANIMLMKSGAKRHVKILDFGIGALTKDARQVDYRTLTLTQETLGTPSYSAPEQLRGESPSIASDLYVWGLVFIECLTRRPAVTGSSLASVFHKQLASENIPLPVSIAGHPIASLLRRVLQKNVKERAVNAGEVYRDLMRINMASLMVKDESERSLGSLLSDQSIEADSSDHTFEETQIVRNDFTYTSLTERKQISVLCLSFQVVKHKPELEREFIETFVRDLKNQCADLAIGYSGQVAGAIGNLLVIYFGYPASTGNDGRLTARTALEIVSLIHRRNANVKDVHGFSIQYRLAIHTGQVTCYSDALPEGETLNKAMDMLLLSRENEIICSSSAEQILKNFIEFDASEPRVLSTGIEEEKIFTVHGERRAEALGFIRANQISSELFGRETEMAWAVKSLSGSGLKFAHIQGDAGIGKSRLVYEVRSAAFVDTRQIVAQCYPEQMYNGLFPVLTLIKGLYHCEAGNEAVARARIEEVLTQQGFDDLSIILQVLIWLSFPLGEEELKGQISSPLDEVTLFNVLTQLLTKHVSIVADNELNNATKAQTEPVLLIIEDLHWADDKTLSFISFFLGQPESQNVRMLTTSRRSLDTTELSGKQIQLKGLKREAIQALIVKRLGNSQVSQDVIEFVVERTDGTPLYVEEVISMLLDKQYIHKINGVFDFVELEKSLTIPTTILDILHNKLDNLKQAKVTAQLAALIGREFDWNMLLSVSKKSVEALQADLDIMVANEVVFRQRRVDCDRYIFKHVLIRDVAGDSASKLFKILNHKACAEYYEEHSNLEHEDDLNSLIYHYDGCENYQSALKYCRTLISKSLDKGAFHQAYEISKKALVYAGELNLAAKDLVSIYSPLTTSAMMIYGWAADEVEQLVDETKRLLSLLKPDEKSVEFSSYWALAIYYEVRGQHLKAVEFIDLAFERSSDEADKSALLALKGHSLWAQGRHDEARKVIADCISLYEKTDPAVHGPRYGQDSKVYALSVLALIEADAGKIKVAEDLSNQSIAHASSVKSQHSLVLAKVYWCCCLYQVREREGFLLVLQEAKKICESAKLGAWDGIILILEGWYENSTQKAEAGLASMLQSGLTEMQGYWNAMIAETEIYHGHTEQALKRVEESILQTTETKEYNFLEGLQDLKRRIKSPECIA